MAKKVTIRDVAQRAGVSVASVSYALNGINKVNEETKKRILQTVAEMNYYPSITAKCMSDGVSRLIGVTLPITEQEDVPGMLFEGNPFFGEFLSGIESVTRKEGYDILIGGMNTDITYKNWVQSRALDGIIMLGVYPEDLFNEISATDIPVVLVDTYEPYAEGFHRVMVDDELGGYTATKHLLDLGHTEIAIAIGNISHSGVLARRYEGYVRALSEAGLKPNPKLFLESRVSPEGGMRVGERIIKEKIQATGIFAVSDVIALGVIKALNRAGVDVPQDISIVGFDDISICSYASVGITTIRQDSVQKGAIGARLIIDDLKRGERTNSLVTLPIQMIVRDSTSRYLR